MTISEIYQLAIKMGIEADPRGKEGVKKTLAWARQDYEELSPGKKEDFDLESLKNPYADTRILFGDPSIHVDKVLAGIDIETGEMVLADHLNEKGEGIDLIISHHPEGSALAGLDEVMDLQVDLLVSYGVPVNVAEGILRERISQVKRGLGPKNHYRSVDAARLLNLPFVCLHTPLDNLGYKFLTDLLNKKKPQIVREVLEVLKEIPEYAQAIKLKAGPSIFAGEERNRAGKVVAGEFTGGTEGAKEMYEKISQAGIGTIIGSHASEEHRKGAKKHHINLVIAGHIVSDSLGMNLFLDELEKRGIGLLPCSGLIRVQRK